MAGCYVALGDSMSLGCYMGGDGRGAASLLCGNPDSDFPGWSGCDLGSAGVTGQILAQDGATAAEVVQHQLPLIARPPTVVTVTMGGEDLIATHGNDIAARAAVDQVLAAAEEVLTRLAAFGSGCTVVVTTVYDPSDGTGALGWSLDPWPCGPALIRELNAGLAGLAARHGAVVADVYARFLGHGVTAGNPSQVLARPASRDLWYCGVIEPNMWGAHEIRCAWWDVLAPLLFNGAFAGAHDVFLEHEEHDGHRDGHRHRGG